MHALPATILKRDQTKNQMALVHSRMSLEIHTTFWDLASRRANDANGNTKHKRLLDFAQYILFSPVALSVVHMAGAQKVNGF